MVHIHTCGHHHPVCFCQNIEFVPLPSDHFLADGHDQKTILPFHGISPLIPWDKLWPRLWKMIPEPLTNQRLIIAVDDCINPKTGRKIFGCDKIFDHAAKLNQSKYPWAQNIVTIGLLKMVKGRWACLALDYRFYHLKKNIGKVRSRLKGKPIEFETKMEQAATMIAGVANQINAPVLAVSDSWFGKNDLCSPLQSKPAQDFNLLSRLRLRSNQNLFDIPSQPDKVRPGRPKKWQKTGQ